MNRHRSVSLVAALVLSSLVLVGTFSLAPAPSVSADVFTHNLKLTTVIESKVSGVVSTRFFSIPQKTLVKLDIRNLRPGGAYWLCVHVRPTGTGKWTPVFGQTYPTYGVLKLTKPDSSGFATGTTWVSGYIWGAHKYFVMLHRSNEKGPPVAYAVLP